MVRNEDLRELTELLAFTEDVEIVVADQVIVPERNLGSVSGTRIANRLLGFERGIGRGLPDLLIGRHNSFDDSNWLSLHDWIQLGA